MIPNPPQRPPHNEDSPTPADFIARLEDYFRSSALNGEDVLPRWAMFSSLED